MPTTARLLAIAVLGASLVPRLHAQVPDSALVRRALRLHRQLPMMDGHNDFPWELRKQGGLSFDRADMRALPPFRGTDSADNNIGFQTDIPRLRAGAVGGLFWSIYMNPSLIPQGALKVALEQMDIVYRMAERYPETFEVARTAADVERIHREGRIASLIGIEGGHAIENSLGALRMLYDAGARYMTLTWNNPLPWAAPQGDTTGRGLSRFGAEVVREMNRLGMLVDLSHVSDSTMVQAIRASEAPVIFSHSSARALADVRRNVPDAVLRMLPANGGVVLVNFLCYFLDSAAVNAERERRPAPPRPALGLVADHIEHIRRVAGVDHVGYGSDFDGISCAPQGLDDVSDFPLLTAELLRRGWSEADVKQVIGGNLLRVMRQAEAVAARLRRTRGPSTATLAQLDSAGVR